MLKISVSLTRIALKLDDRLNIAVFMYSVRGYEITSDTTYIKYELELYV